VSVSAYEEDPMQSHEQASGNPRPAGPPRVLVVDDDPAVRRLCTRILKSDGYDVFEAANGQEGLELALVNALDLVLLDISMPVLDGFGLAAALAADERTRDLPLVFVSGEADPLVKARAFETGARGFIEKPYEPGTLRAFVSSMVAQVIPKPTLSVVDP
jgi:CheY-like chemotaxis protein